MKTLLHISFLSLCILVMPAVMFGAPVSGSWGGVGYSDFNAQFGLNNGYIWHTGDYWQEIVFSTGLTTVNSLALDLSFENVLDPGFSQTFAVLLNNTSVGSFSVATGQTSFSNLFNFSSVAGANGTNYTIRLQQTSPDIPDPNGSLRLLIEGESTYRLDNGVTAVPEPATLTLVVLGLGIGGLVRRRRSKAS
jgi:PEP-CTERM motif